MLRNCHSVEYALQDLPTTLDDTYKRILRRLNPYDWELTRQLFECILASFRPLTVNELAEVLAIDISYDIPRLIVNKRPSNPEATIATLCSTLVVIHPETKHVQFAHFSVQEYLLSSRLACESDQLLSRLHIVPRDAYVAIAKACMAVLFSFQVSASDSDDMSLTLSAFKVCISIQRNSKSLSYPRRHYTET